ncbi:DNRLRE domain-containing protein [Blastopirellula sp. J2-11]|uniref:CBM96 family carbohydrate-binding protein n=1 Tax=Blastopirellula sp. J2-11 TaxID=2943192 RepID=UPI0021C8AC25|nr:DNRLRE domain-containing protein [Blastopirellula sp. J2-11]UUO08707.1 DNRLRE domain-containing protein [Blastopirellula sp. J2-11]
MSQTDERDAFYRLCDAVLDGRSTPDELAQLESLILGLPELRREYVEISHLHASLRLAGEGSPGAGEPAVPSSPTSRRKITTSLQTFLWSATAAALALAASVFGILFAISSQDRAPQPFVSISSTAGSQFASATFSTTNDSRIGAGRVKLKEGIVTLRFDVGALVELEGPADFEILNPMKGRLHDGKLVATVGAAAKGFSIETPDANLIDQGTCFGVVVTDQGSGCLQVFEGLVDVEHRQSGKQISVRESQSLKITSERVDWLEETQKYGKEQYRGSSSETPRQTQITTATGAGSDHWLIRDEAERYGPQDLLMIKWAEDDWSNFDRKIYLKFDLSGVDVKQVSEAVLSVTASDTQLGFASRMPDATYAVYAVTNDQLDYWEPDTLTWKNAPANVDAADRLDITQTQMVGRFQIPHGQKHGLFSIDSPALLDIVRHDANRLVTLVIVPETQEAKGDALVHGFASGNHATLPPPTLRLTMADAP